VMRGDIFTAVGGSGGGYGDPYERLPEAVLDDVLDGYISADDAASFYGVVLTNKNEINFAATTGLRNSQIKH
jgi:N-methylhydantoinase B